MREEEEYNKILGNRSLETSTREGGEEPREPEASLLLSQRLLQRQHVQPKWLAGLVEAMEFPSLHLAQTWKPPRDPFITAGPWAEKSAETVSCQLCAGLKCAFVSKDSTEGGRSRHQCSFGHRLRGAGKARPLIPILLFSSCSRNAVFRAKPPR